MHIERLFHTVCTYGFAKAEQEFYTKEGAFSLFLLLLLNTCRGCRWKWWFARGYGLAILAFSFFFYFFFFNEQNKRTIPLERWEGYLGSKVQWIMSGSAGALTLLCTLLWNQNSSSEREMSGNHSLRFFSKQKCNDQKTVFLQLDLWCKFQYLSLHVTLNVKWQKHSE